MSLAVNLNLFVECQMPDLHVQFKMLTHAVGD